MLEPEHDNRHPCKKVTVILLVSRDLCDLSRVLYESARVPADERAM